MEATTPQHHPANDTQAAAAAYLASQDDEWPTTVEDWEWLEEGWLTPEDEAIVTEWLARPPSRHDGKGRLPPPYYP